MPYSLLVSGLQEYFRNIFRVRRVVVHLRGGIGNQLFQSAAGMYFADYLRVPLVLDKTTVAIHDENNPADISGFSRFRDITRNSHKFQRFLRVLLIKCCNSLLNVDVSSFGIKQIGEYDHVTRIFRSIHLSGYFSDFHYADSINFNKLDLELNHESNWYLKMKKELDSEPTIAMHVRRGDFLTNPTHYGILSSEYYLGALSNFPENLSNYRIWVFSDDPNLAQIELKSSLRQRTTYIIPDGDSNALESFLLISKSNAVIVANSTFSLWAAYLNTDAKFVVYPKNDKNGQSLLPKLPETWLAVRESWK